jgi:hypothetical protein
MTKGAEHMTTTKTKATTENLTAEQQYALNSTAGPGIESSRIAADQQAAELARVAWLAAGGEEGEKERAEVARTTEQELADAQKSSRARIASLRTSIGDAPTWQDEHKRLEAVLHDPSSTVTDVIAAHVELCVAWESADRLQAHGNLHIASESGVNSGPLREALQRESVASVLDRWVSVRVDPIVTAAVSDMMTAAAAAWTEAVK